MLSHDQSASAGSEGGTALQPAAADNRAGPTSSHGIPDSAFAALQDYDYGSLSLPDPVDSYTGIRAALDAEQGR